MVSDDRARLPAIGRLLARDDVMAMVAVHGRAAVTEVLRDVVDAAREAREPLDETEAVARARTLIAQRARGTLVPVINATGIVLHTNLGRAELSSRASEAAASVGAGACALEIDLDSGERGSRHVHATARLSNLTGAPDALVANNAAAALLLALSALAKGAPVIVSRGELVEIGGAFRIPEIIETGGARLHEVGTTNRTRASDYERALAALGEPATPIILKVHRSNFAIVGFTEEASLEDLVAIGKRHGARVVYDLGSGLLLPGARLGLPGEPNVSSAIAAGADVVVFSADKLLGGPQAGIAVGAAPCIESMRRHPLMRALRAGKMVLAALDATLAEYRHDDVLTRLPSLAKLTAKVDDVRARAERLALAIEGADVVPTIARVGAGAQPTTEIPSFAARLPVRDPAAVSRALRLGTPAIVARIEDGALLFDARTIADGEVASVAHAIGRARSAG